MKTVVKKPVLSLIIACAIIFMVPVAIRLVTADGYPLGYRSYWDMNHASLSSQGLVAKDLSTFHPQVSIMSASDFIMGWISSFMGAKLAFLLIPPLLGLLSATMLYLILRKVGIDTNHRLAMSLFFATTPAFFWTFASGTLLSLSFTIVVAAVYLFLKKRAVFFLLSLVLYLIIPTLGVTCLIVSLFPLAYSMAATKSKKAMALAAAALLSSTAYYGYLLWLFGMPEIPKPYAEALLPYFISDLGGAPALGIFFIVLSAVGLIYSWKFKGKFAPFYILAALLFVVSLYDAKAILFLAVPISAFAGIGMNELFGRTWRLPFIRDFSFILVICGVLFSIISFADSSFMEGPTKEEIESLRWVARNAVEGTIVTLPETGQFVYHITGRQVVADGQERIFSENRGERDIEEMFGSRNLARTRELMETYDVSVIWLPPWEEQDLRSTDATGLLFLFRNNETFKNIQPDSVITIWAFLPYLERGQ